jgi:hypothetical protein
MHATIVLACLQERASSITPFVECIPHTGTFYVCRLENGYRVPVLSISTVTGTGAGTELPQLCVKYHYFGTPTSSFFGRFIHVVWFAKYFVPGISGIVTRKQI